MGDDDPATGRQFLTRSAYADDRHPRSRQAICQETPLSFPDAEPVVDYLDSVREPILSDVGEPFDFDAALDDVAARVDQVIRTEGRFRAVVRGGVFVCR